MAASLCGQELSWFFWGHEEASSWREPQAYAPDGDPAQVWGLGPPPGDCPRGPGSGPPALVSSQRLTKSPILQVSKLRLFSGRSHSSEAAELGLQGRIWANTSQDERPCVCIPPEALKVLGQMRVSDATAGGRPPSRALTR